MIARGWSWTMESGQGLQVGWVLLGEPNLTELN